MYIQNKKISLHKFDNILEENMEEQDDLDSKFLENLNSYDNKSPIFQKIGENKLGEIVMYFSSIEISSPITFLLNQKEELKLIKWE